MRYILISGAAGGMGQAAVQRLTQAGFTVFALDQVPIPARDNVIPLEADITDDESLRQAFDRVRSITEELFAIVHFAGIYMLDSLVEMESKTFVRAFDINVFGAFRLNRCFLPLLGPGSRILITTSELAPLDPLPFTGLYAVTKSALDKYAFALRMELQLRDIAVTVLRPGAVSTGMLKASTDALDRFCRRTQLYAFNARRFQRIVGAVETRNIPPEKIADRTLKILQARRPRLVYSLNRNPLLLLMHLLPPRWQTRIIGRILR